MKENCNACGKNSCRWARQALKISQERIGKLNCFIPIQKSWLFADCVSRVVIENSQNPALKYFAPYMK